MTTDKRKYHILIVEDNPGDFALVEDFLFEQINAPVIVNALNCKSAKELLLNPANKFDVVLLDLSLPDKTGEPLIDDITGLAGNIPVIVLTGYTDLNFGVRSLSLGVSDYLLKDELTSFSLYKSILYSAERKRINADLGESEKKYSELFNLSPLPMWVYDIADLKFLDVNMAAIVHYGYSREDFLSMTIKDIRPVEELPKLEETLLRSSKDGLYYQGTFIHKKKNGELIKTDVKSNVIIYNGKKAKIILANDVTEKVTYLKALEGQNKKLKEISWMQSHLVRAPLARILGLVPLLEDTTATIDEKMEMMGYLLTSAQDLDEIIREITDKARTTDEQVPGYGHSSRDV